MNTQSSNSFGARFRKEIKDHLLLIILTAAFLGLSFSIYAFLDVETISNLGREDGLYESLTALFFLAGAVVAFLVFLKKKSWFLLLLAVFLFFGMGEEISWGQRIFGFKTPEAVSKINVQHEFNLHNVEAVNSRTFNRTDRLGWSRLLSINFLYKLFWFAFGVLLPLGAYLFGFVGKLAGRLRIPIPPLSLGIFFLVNYLVMKTMGALLTNRAFQYLDSLGEIYECGTALVFLVVCWAFFKESRRATAPASA